MYFIFQYNILFNRIEYRKLCVTAISTRHSGISCHKLNRIGTKRALGALLTVLRRTRVAWTSRVQKMKEEDLTEVMGDVTFCGQCRASHIPSLTPCIHIHMAMKCISLKKVSL